MPKSNKTSQYDPKLVKYVMDIRTRIGDNIEYSADPIIKMVIKKYKESSNEWRVARFQDEATDNTGMSKLVYSLGRMTSFGDCGSFRAANDFKKATRLRINLIASFYDLADHVFSGSNSQMILKKIDKLKNYFDVYTQLDAVMIDLEIKNEFTQTLENVKKRHLKLFIVDQFEPYGTSIFTADTLSKIATLRNDNITDLEIHTVMKSIHDDLQSKSIADKIKRPIFRAILAVLQVLHIDSVALMQDKLPIARCGHNLRNLQRFFPLVTSKDSAIGPDVSSGPQKRENP